MRENEAKTALKTHEKAPNISYIKGVLSSGNKPQDYSRSINYDCLRQVMSYDTLRVVMSGFAAFKATGRSYHNECVTLS